MRNVTINSLCASACTNSNQLMAWIGCRLYYFPARQPSKFKCNRLLLSLIQICVCVCDRVKGKRVNHFNTSQLLASLNTPRALELLGPWTSSGRCSPSSLDSFPEPCDPLSLSVMSLVEEPRSASSLADT